MNVKLRKDLEFTKRELRQNECWIVKDPVSFDHYLFSGPEFYLLNLFDGVRANEEIHSEWQSHFRTSSLTLDQVKTFSQRLIRDNLVAVEQFGYGSSLHQSDRERKKGKLKSILFSPLVIRFRGINPGGLLDAFTWLGWVLFHPMVILLTMFLSMIVLVSTIGQFDEVARRLPTISQLLSTQGIIGIVVTISIVKILHELGHAMACRRCGGECFEIGLIFLAFIPTLYCNVSDAWTFPEKWKRMMVSFAGIYVEILLATIAAVVWWTSGTGVLNAMMFNVMMLCSINSILINGNPLLRYDGYYLLSDFADRPNLGTLSRQVLGYEFVSMFRIPKKELSYPKWVLVYSTLSFIYRWFVVCSIVIMIFLALKSVGLRVAGKYIAAVLIATLLVRPVMGSSLFRKTTSNWGRFSLVRSAFPIALMALFGFVFFYIPLPGHVRCNLVVEAENPTQVYIPSDGRLTMICKEFDAVQEGQLIAKIESIEIDQSLRKLRNKLQRSHTRLEQLKSRMNEEPLAASQIAVVSKDIEATEAELLVLEKDHSRLQVRSPVDGTVHPAPINKIMFANDGQFRRWQGKLTDEVNQNCYVKRGDHLVSILPSGQKSVTLFVGERDVDLLSQGQELHVMFNQLPGESFEGTVGEIYEVDVNVNERGNGSTGIETYEDASGSLKTVQTPYRVTAIIETLPEEAFVGSGGRASVTVPSKTLAEKTYDFIERIATLEL